MRKAKFLVEVEYDETSKSISAKNTKVTKCEIEGDYQGLTIAMSCGLAFSELEGKGRFETFKRKMLIVRSTVSALGSIIASLRHSHYFKDKEVSMGEREEGMILKTMKSLGDLITYGLSKVFDITNEEMKEANEDYIIDKDGKKGKQGFGGNDIGNFI